MDIKKTRIQFTLFDDFEGLEEVSKSLEEHEGYNELSDEELIKRVQEEDEELTEDDVKSLKDTLSDAKFVEIEDAIVLISPRMISITGEDGVDGAQEDIREVLDENEVQYEEDVGHSVEVDNPNQVLESDLQGILGKYNLNIVIEGENGSLTISENDNETRVSGKKPLLEELKEEMQDRQ